MPALVPGTMTLFRQGSRLANKAFTLLEVLIVIAIIGAILALILPGLQKAKQISSVHRMAMSALGKPTSGTVFPAPWATEDTEYEDAYQNIRATLKRAEVDQFGLYLIPGIESTKNTNAVDGFMVLTAPERINFDGTYTTNRWNLARQLKEPTTLTQTFLSFFQHAPEGRFRFFVVACTTQPPISNSAPPLWASASRWHQKAGDYAHLPESIRAQKLGGARIHIYVYVYARERLETLPHAVAEDAESVMAHIKGAGILDLTKELKK